MNMLCANVYPNTPVNEKVLLQKVVQFHYSTASFTTKYTVLLFTELFHKVFSFLVQHIVDLSGGHYRLLICQKFTSTFTC